MSFLFVPDWPALADPKVYLAALGQAFFSISVGLGTLITYGSYLPARFSLASSAFVIALGDTIIAILAGVIIFPPCSPMVSIRPRVRGWHSSRSRRYF